MSSAAIRLAITFYASPVDNPRIDGRQQNGPRANKTDRVCEAHMLQTQTARGQNNFQSEHQGWSARSCQPERHS